jgi:hypothetical protein
VQWAIVAFMVAYLNHNLKLWDALSIVMVLVNKDDDDDKVQWRSYVHSFNIWLSQRAEVYMDYNSINRIFASSLYLPHARHAYIQILYMCLLVYWL